MFHEIVEIFVNSRVIRTFTFTKFTDEQAKLMFISLGDFQTVFWEQECSYKLDW